MLSLLHFHLRLTKKALHWSSNSRQTSNCSFQLLISIYFYADAPFANTTNECYISSEVPQDKQECDVEFYSNPNATFVSVDDANLGKVR